METENQIPTSGLAQTLIPIVPPWWSPRVKLLPLHNNNKSRNLAGPSYYCVCPWVSFCVYVCVVWPLPTSFQSNNMATYETHIHSSITSLPSSIPTSIFHSSFPPTVEWLKVMTSVALHKVTIVCLPAFFHLVTFLYTNSPYTYRSGQTKMAFNFVHMKCNKNKWGGGYWKPVLLSPLLQINKSMQCPCLV